MIALPSDVPDIAADYERQFSLLAELAESLNIPSDRADKWIDTLLIASLYKPPTGEDVDTWFRAAFTQAAQQGRA